MKFLDEAGVKALEAAGAEIEKVSAVEVVLAVRPRAGLWLVQHVLVAVAAGLAVLAFTLWSHHAFAAWQMFVLPVAAGVVGAIVAEIPPLYRFLVPRIVRYDHVREAARTVFVDKRVHATRGRTGLLVYMALRERLVELVGDTVVDEQVGRKLLGEWARKLEAALPDGAEATAKVLGGFAGELAARLPRTADDVNEIADDLQVIGRPPRR